MKTATSRARRPQPFDMRELTDRDAIGMVNALRNAEARALWVRALRWTTGDEAVPFLRALLAPGNERQGLVVTHWRRRNPN